MKKKLDAFQTARFPELPHHESIDLRGPPAELSSKKREKLRIDADSKGEVVRMDVWKDSTMEELIASAKDLIRENIEQSF